MLQKQNPSDQGSANFASRRHVCGQGKRLSARIRAPNLAPNSAHTNLGDTCVAKVSGCRHVSPPRLILHFLACPALYATSTTFTTSYSEVNIDHIEFIFTAFCSHYRVLYSVGIANAITGCKSGEGRVKWDTLKSAESGAEGIRALNLALNSAHTNLGIFVLA